VFQTITRNPLASPDILGITFGASAAAVATIVLGGGAVGGLLGALGTPLAALLGGLLSATVVADDLTTADVLATTVFALGPAGVRWALDAGARGVLAMDAAGRVLGAGELRFAKPMEAG